MQQFKLFHDFYVFSVFQRLWIINISNFQFLLFGNYIITPNYLKQ